MNKKIALRNRRASGPFTIIDVFSIFLYVLIVIIFIILFRITGCVSAQQEEKGVKGQLALSAELSGFFSGFLQTPVEANGQSMSMAELIARSQNPLYRRILKGETQRIIKSAGMRTSFTIDINFSNGDTIQFIDKDSEVRGDSLYKGFLPGYDGEVINISIIAVKNETQLTDYVIAASRAGDFVFRDKKMFVWWGIDTDVWSEEGNPCKTKVLNTDEGPLSWTVACEDGSPPDSYSDAPCFISTEEFKSGVNPACPQVSP